MGECPNLKSKRLFVGEKQNQPPHKTRDNQCYKHNLNQCFKLFPPVPIIFARIQEFGEMVQRHSPSLPSAAVLTGTSAFMCTIQRLPRPFGKTELPANVHRLMSMGFCGSGVLVGHRSTTATAICDFVFGCDLCYCFKGTSNNPVFHICQLVGSIEPCGKLSFGCS